MGGWVVGCTLQHSCLGLTHSAAGQPGHLWVALPSPAHTHLLLSLHTRAPPRAAPPPHCSQVGLDVWLRDGKVFTCWTSMWDVIWHGELGSSLALLNAGAVCIWGWWWSWVGGSRQLQAGRQPPVKPGSDPSRPASPPCAAPSYCCCCRCRRPAGFGLDSFMVRYQGVDWLDKKNWKCNKQ